MYSVVLAMQGASQGEDLAVLHRSALKAYIFFLHWAAQQCEAEDLAASVASGIPTTAKLVCQLAATPKHDSNRIWLQASMIYRSYHT